MNLRRLIGTLRSSTGRVAVPLLIILLGAYLALVYGRGLHLPFLNDDYVFLDKVRGLSFSELWKPERLFFNWYRPWSRELHFWVLRNVAGLREWPFHLVSFGLWMATMVLYFLFVRRLSGPSAAAIATGGLAGLALWSAPLLWISGAQDLWMLFFALLFLHALARGRDSLGLLFLLLALLSKEAAAVLPAVAFCFLWLIEGRSPIQALRRTAWNWALLIVWFVVHPTLMDRFFGPLQHSLETEGRLGPGSTMLMTLLAQLNLDGRFDPDGGWGLALARGAMSAAILAILVIVISRTASRAGSEEEPRRAGAVIAFGLLWTAAGWAILFLPSIGWHSYYGVLGSLGCWLVIGTALRRRLGVAVAVVLVVATLREARATTPSWDWGTDWYQQRAGNLLGAIRDRLFELHPEFPAHSRIFLARIPNNIGLLAGDGPALRVWYDDPTLKAGYYSSYTPRLPGETSGVDYFLRFDTLQVLVEVESGPATRVGEFRTYPGWQRDQSVLASLFLRSGSPRAAAAAFARVFAGSPDLPNYAVFAATAYEVAGDTLEADRYYHEAVLVDGDSLVGVWRKDLLEEARRYAGSSRR